MLYWLSIISRSQFLTWYLNWNETLCSTKRLAWLVHNEWKSNHPTKRKKVPTYAIQTHDMGYYVTIFWANNLSASPSNLPAIWAIRSAGHLRLLMRFCRLSHIERIYTQVAQWVRVEPNTCTSVDYKFPGFILNIKKKHLKIPKERYSTTAHIYWYHSYCFNRYKFKQKVNNWHVLPSGRYVLGAMTLKIWLRKFERHWFFANSWEIKAVPV